MTRTHEQKSGRQWNQQLGPSLALFDVGIAALTASGDPKNKEAVAEALKTLAVETPLGNLDWSKGPVPNVTTAPIIDGQWVKGSTWTFDWVSCENAGDPNVAVQAKLLPYS
ncbi:MAG: hypothetical protein M5U22_18900 [Thermoleophilia bacterium]|nr:hypothetical protein [Thermoleophilia bacterium]